MNNILPKLLYLLFIIIQCCSAFVPLQQTQKTLSPSAQLHLTVKDKTDIKDRIVNNLPLQQQAQSIISISEDLSTEQQQQQIDATTILKDAIIISDNNNDNENNNNQQFEGLLWRGVILVLCGLWASNFSAAKLILAEPGVDSSLYAVARFAVAALALAPAGFKHRHAISSDTLVKSIQCGSWVAFGYLGQTLGLLTTTASKSCVICSLHCVFVAALAEYWRVQRFEGDEETAYNIQRLLPAFLAVAGVAVIELQGAGGVPTIGDALSLAQPIGFGMGYLTLEEIMADQEAPDAALPVTTIKLCVVAVASLLLFEVLPHITGTSTEILQIPDFTPILQSPLALGGILYTGLITTALALWVEGRAFSKVPATDASLILTTEPLMAAGIGSLLLGETFGMSDYVGASMIVGACVLATLLDTPASGDDDCDPNVDTDCQLERKTPFGVF